MSLTIKTDKSCPLDSCVICHFLKLPAVLDSVHVVAISSGQMACKIIGFTCIMYISVTYFLLARSLNLYFGVDMYIFYLEFLQRTLFLEDYT